MDASGVGLQKELIRGAIWRMTETFQICRLDMRTSADSDQMDHHTVQTPPWERLGRVVGEELLVLSEEFQRLRDTVPLVQVVAG